MMTDNSGQSGAFILPSIYQNSELYDFLTTVPDFVHTAGTVSPSSLYTKYRKHVFEVLQHVLK